MSGFWNMWVWVLTLGTLVGCLWLLQSMTTRPGDSQEKETTGHSWDGDLKEFNNPLPRWWLWLFWITGVFMVVYLVIYPGLGSFSGTADWTQKQQYETEVAVAEKRFGNVYAAFAGMTAPELANHADAVRLGRNIFLNRCATCHGSDGRGARGFPDLTDSSWIWGNSADAIRQTISEGRTGVMPALGAALGEQGVDDVIAYIRTLRATPAPAVSPAAAYTPGEQPETGNAPPAPRGQQQFQTFCTACHGADGRGNPALGAPNLTDDDWLHGSSDENLRGVINKGRVNQMPAQKDFLTPDRIHVVTGYVLSMGSGTDSGSGE